MKTQLQTCDSLTERDQKPVRVLLIEDSPIDTMFLCADFRKYGESEFSLKAVSRLDEAVAVLNSEPVDIILLDLLLEEIQGLETLSAVHKTAPDVPVVVLTNLDNEAMALQSLKNGAQDYLIKGRVDSRVLFRVIRYALERKQFEADRRSLETRLLQLNKLEALGTLAGGVAHNFNNIMMTILGHCHLLIEKTSENDQRRHLDSITKAAERASGLIRQLLMFSHREAAGQVPMNVNKTVSDMEELVRSVLRNPVKVSFELSPHAGLIKGCPDQIQHIVMSLVLNAREAVGPAGHIVVRTESRTTEVGSEVTLTVSDDGCGMSAETQAHIFEPFFTTKGLATATGLGLSTVYGIVEQHGGSIRVESEPGKGSSFIVRLPMMASTVNAA